MISYQLKLSRNKIFVIGVALILVFITINRVNFIIGSNFTKGTIIKLQTVRGSKGYTSIVPIVRFVDEQKYLYTFRGEREDSDYKIGEKVTVVYKVKDPSDAAVFSFIGFILSPLIYALLPLLFLAAAVYSFIAKNETVTFSIRGIVKNKSSDLQSFNDSDKFINRSIGDKK